MRAEDLATTCISSALKVQSRVRSANPFFFSVMGFRQDVAVAYKEAKAMAQRKAEFAVGGRWRGVGGAATPERVERAGVPASRTGDRVGVLRLAAELRRGISRRGRRKGGRRSRRLCRLVMPQEHASDGNGHIIIELRARARVAGCRWPCRRGAVRRIESARYVRGKAGRRDSDPAIFKCSWRPAPVGHAAGAFDSARPKHVCGCSSGMIRSAAPCLSSATRTPQAGQDTLVG